MIHQTAQPAPGPGLRRLLAIALAFCAALAPAAHCRAEQADVRPASKHFDERAERREFIDAMVSRHGFERAELERLLGSLKPDARVLALMDPRPGKSGQRSWHDYRRRFTNRTRVDAGVQFWARHGAAIERASARYGVSAEIIVAIIGVETIYGRYTGDFRVLESLATLAFDYPRRAEFFSRELEQFLVLARENGVDPATVRGSYAGAIGLPQFMPSSIRNYAVDFDADGRIDLAGSPEDAIGSVANFLAEHGWQRGEPTHFNARLAADARIDPLLAAGIEPNFELAELARHGVHTDDLAASGMRLALIDLPNAGTDPSYALGARNFYVITRYNRSSFYAMAVIELGRAISEARDRVRAPKRRG